MKTAKCAFNAAVALQRVFVRPIEHSSLLQLRSLQIQPLSPFPTKSRSIFQRNYAFFTAPASPQTEGVKWSLPRDEEIISRYIHVVDENGKLTEPLLTSKVRTSINRKTHTLVTVAMPPPVRHDDDDGEEVWEDDGQPRIPICRILSKQALREHEKAAQKQKRDPSKLVKTLELNWAIDGHDLGHRLDRLKDFLSKGHRVEVVMASKKKGRKATMEEAGALLKRIRAAIKEVDGAREWKPMDGRELSQATMYIERKSEQG